MWKTRLKIVGMGLLVIFGFGILVGVLLPHLKFRESKAAAYNTATLLKSIQGVSDLVTVKYVMEKVVVLQDPPQNIFAQFMTGESRVVLVAHGIVKAGVDLGKLSENNLKLAGTNLVITLPAAEITDVYLDDNRTAVVEHKTGFLRHFDASLPQNARKQALDDMRRAARYNGITNEADARARIQLNQLFAPLGIAVEFTENKLPPEKSR